MLQQSIKRLLGVLGQEESSVQMGERQPLLHEIKIQAYQSNEDKEKDEKYAPQVKIYNSPYFSGREMVSQIPLSKLYKIQRLLEAEILEQSNLTTRGKKRKNCKFSFFLILILAALGIGEYFIFRYIIRASQSALSDWNHLGVLGSENKTCAEIYNNVAKCRLSGDVDGGINVETLGISDVNDSFCFYTLIELCTFGSCGLHPDFFSPSDCHVSGWKSDVALIIFIGAIAVLLATVMACVLSENPITEYWNDIRSDDFFRAQNALITDIKMVEVNLPGCLLQSKELINSHQFFVQRHKMIANVFAGAGKNASHLADIVDEYMGIKIA